MAIKNDEQIISALLLFGEVRRAAKKLRISESTIYSRLRDSEFRQQYDEARADLLRENCNKLQSSISQAIDTLYEVMINPQVAPQIRLNAAAEILRSSDRLTQQCDILERLEKLEAVTEFV